MLHSLNHCKIVWISPSLSHGMGDEHAFLSLYLRDGHVPSLSQCLREPVMAALSSAHQKVFASAVDGDVCVSNVCT